MNPSQSEVFPYVFTSYRLTEHHTAGAMSRTLPYLSELQPEPFCEVSPRLARERGLEHGGWATIVTGRTAIEARVLVTERMRSLRLGDRVGRAGRPALPLGPERHHRAATPRTTWSTSRWTRTSTSRTRSAPATSSPAGARAARRSRRTSRTTVAGPASRSQRTEASTDGQALRTARRRVGRRRVRHRAGRPPPADGLLHRHLGVHRLQGVRGGLQGVERRSRRRLPPHRDVVRQHPGARCQHVAPRGLRREEHLVGARPSTSACRGRGRPV